MKRIAFFIGLLSFSIAHAQKDTVDLTPVEVSSIRAGSTAPFAKTNITKAGISKQNLGQDLPFLLNTTPSAVINSDAGNGVGYTGIRIRGTDATRINVTLNGIPFNDAEGGGTYFVDLPDFASSVNSIQIQRGVGTSTNGAGAFGATIALSTNETFLKPYAEINNSYGSFNTLKNTLQAGSGLYAKHFTTDFRLSRITSDGYIDRASSNLKSFYFSQGFISGNTSLKLNIFSGKEKTYQAWYGVTEADLKNNRTVNYAGTEKPGAPYDNETDNYTQTHYQLFFNQKLSPKLAFNTGVFYVKGKGYYEQYKAGQDYATYNLKYPVKGADTTFETDLVRRLWLDNDFYGAIFSLQQKSEKTNLIFGGAATNYIGNHYGEVVWAQKGFTPNGHYYDLDAHKSDINAYAKWQQNLTDKLQLFTDLQWRHLDYTINGFQYNPTLFLNKKYDFINPKAGLSYVSGNALLFASYSIAHKEPNRDDFEAGKTEQPRPERLNDLELGVSKKEAKYNVGATLYYMKYKDQLVLTGKINNVGAYTRTNIKDSYRMGAELEGGAKIAAWLAAAGNLTISKNEINNFDEFIDDYDNGGQKVNHYGKTNISFSPDVIGSASLVFTPVKKLELYLVSKYVGKQYLDNTNNEARKLDAYFTEDARAVYSFTAKHFKNISLIAQVNNLFNKMYAPNGYTYSYYSNSALTTENYYFPMAGTNFNVGLNIKL